MWAQPAFHPPKPNRDLNLPVMLHLMKLLPNVPYITPVPGGVGPMTIVSLDEKYASGQLKRKFTSNRIFIFLANFCSIL